MDKDVLKDQNCTGDTVDMESWEDDCGLSDLARDQFSQIGQTLDLNRSTRTNRNE